MRSSVPPAWAYTLINRLLGKERLETGELRNDDKSHHTAMHRELLALSCGAMVIDTSGMREPGLWDSSEGSVKAAPEGGTLSHDRWLSYQKLRAENAYAEAAESYLAAKRFKEISKTKKLSRKR